MKFTTAFGLGEIVCTRQRETVNGIFPDMLLKVVAIQFSLDGQTAYLCRSARAGNIVVCVEDELMGDPDFNQDTGAYSNV